MIRLVGVGIGGLVGSWEALGSIHGRLVQGCLLNKCVITAKCETCVVRVCLLQLTQQRVHRLEHGLHVGVLRQGGWRTLGWGCELAVYVA